MLDVGGEEQNELLVEKQEEDVDWGVVARQIWGRGERGEEFCILDH